MELRSVHEALRQEIPHRLLLSKVGLKTLCLRVAVTPLHSALKGMGYDLAVRMYRLYHEGVGHGTCPPRGRRE